MTEVPDRNTPCAKTPALVPPPFNFPLNTSENLPVATELQYPHLIPPLGASGPIGVVGNRDQRGAGCRASVAACSRIRVFGRDRSYFRWVARPFLLLW